jgi:asparaginyl-tRNA synthetase
MVNCDPLQNQRLKAILTVRTKIFETARSWLNKHGFIEVQGPILIPPTGKGANSFSVDYFGKKACLSQGLQPYSQVFAQMFGKIYTIAPTFRAEKLKTKRHLAEYWRIEVGDSLLDFEKLIGIQEDLVSHICHNLSRVADEELKMLGRSPSDLTKVQTPFPKLTYDNAIGLLQNAGLEIQWGDELTWEMESALSLRFNQPFFVTEFPIMAETFFLASHPLKSELTLSADLMAPEGYGELGSGGQMINKKETLLKRMIEAEIAPSDQQWYMSFMECSSLTYSGFAMGIERIIQWICKLEKTQEATAFPRQYDDLYP